MPPVTLMVKPVSGLCNMRCAYCFYADEMQNRTVSVYQPMTDETLTHLVRRAFAYGDGSLALMFQGGEPTLAGAAFYRKLLQLEKVYNARGLPVRHALQTNGLFLDDALLDVLGEGQFLVGVSLDGCKAIHDSRRVDAAGAGTWDRVMETLARLRQRKLNYNILCVVDEAIGSRPDEVFQTLREHQYLQFIPCLNPLDGAASAVSLSPKTYGRFLLAMFDHYEKALRGGRATSIRLFDDWLNLAAGYAPGECGYFGQCEPYFLVESDGSVYPCDFYALDEWRMGNVNEQSFFRLQRSAAAQAFRQRADDPGCRACPWRLYCRYGCRREQAEPVPGQTGRNRWCLAYQTFFQGRQAQLRALAADLLKTRR